MYSVGLFSSWCFHKQTRTLFDCGDGVSQSLRNGIFKIDRVVLSHPHIDHVAGLVSLVGLRSLTAGGNDKPLDVWCDLDNPWMSKFVKLVQDLNPQERLKYKLTFKNIKAGDSIDIGGKHYIKVFKMNHSSVYGSLGFCVCQESKKLKPGIDPKTVGARIVSGELKQVDVMERKDIKLFAYTLDNSGFDTEEIKGVQEVVLDCTFLNESDRKEKTHASLKECEKVIMEIRPDRAYLAHISPRYEITYGEFLIWNKSSGLWLKDANVSFEEMSKQVSKELSRGK
jgi:ribonuclease Z